MGWKSFHINHFNENLSASLGPSQTFEIARCYLDSCYTCVPSQADRRRLVLDISSGWVSSSLSEVKVNLKANQGSTDG